MLIIKRTLVIILFWIETTVTWNLNFNTHRHDDSYDSYGEDIQEYSNDIPGHHRRSSHSFNEISPSHHNRNTQYYYKRHQSAVVSIPKHSRHRKVHVSPDENETQSYMTRVDTTHLTSRKYRGDEDFESQYKPFFRTGKLCIKCPVERILIAKRGVDGVLVDIPELTTCSGDRPVSKSLYDLETLFSSKHHFILPRGSHTFIGQVISKKNYTIEHVCLLKYKIIVRTCGPFVPQNENVRAKCEMADIWGSRCTFSCRNNGILTHREPVVCNDNLQWQGSEPECIQQSREYYRQIEGAINSCQLPSPPEHGKFSCKVNRDSINEIDNEILIPDSTVCRVKCAKLYDIPNHLQKFSTFQCHNGRWNYTNYMDFCSRIHARH